MKRKKKQRGRVEQMQGRWKKELERGEAEAQDEWRDWMWEEMEDRHENDEKGAWEMMMVGKDKAEETQPFFFLT